jgi:hypothetical protein
MTTTSKKAKAASPNSLNKIQGEPMKIFDSDKISEIESFDRLDCLKRKSENKSRNSIGSLTLESPEPMSNRKERGVLARSPMGEVEGLDEQNNHLETGRSSKREIEKEIVPPGYRVALVRAQEGDQMTGYRVALVQSKNRSGYRVALVRKRKGKEHHGYRHVLVRVQRGRANTSVVGRFHLGEDLSHLYVQET